MGSASTTYAPDALASLRESYALHLDATRAPRTRDVYLAALDSLRSHFEANGMPLTAAAIRREHIESWMAARRDNLAPASMSLHYRALVRFCKWAVDEDEVERSPIDKMQAPRVPDKPVPVLTATTSGRRFGRPGQGRAPADCEGREPLGHRARAPRRLPRSSTGCSGSSRRCPRTQRNEYELVRSHSRRPARPEIKPS